VEEGWKGKGLENVIATEKGGKGGWREGRKKRKLK
jgi:hypothetical protein